MITKNAVRVDKNILCADSCDAIPRLSDEFYKGGILEDVVPEGVIQDILSADPKKLDACMDRWVHPTSTGRTLDFPEDFRRALKPDTLDFANYVTSQFNQVGPWPVKFVMRSHLSSIRLTRGFHTDNRVRQTTRLSVINASVSNPEDQDHETEILMTDDLTPEQIKEVLGDDTPLQDLPEHIRSNVRSLNTRDMGYFKSLGRNHNDIKTQAVVHRAPPHKRDYKQDGKPRYSFGWCRNTAGEYAIDLD